MHNPILYAFFFSPDRIQIIEDFFFNHKPLVMTESNIIILECFTLQTKPGDTALCMSNPAVHT